MFGVRPRIGLGIQCPDIELVSYQRTSDVLPIKRSRAWSSLSIDVY